jgi:FixJ family two-component response regulator/N-acetylglutamate synthase-like GNAT family acetyltransferase
MVHIVDPDFAVEEALMELFKAHDFEVRAFEDAETYLQFHLASKESPICLLVERSLPGMNGLSLLKRMRDRGFGGPIIMMMSTKDQKTRQQALELGATEVLQKPLINGLLMEKVEPLLINKEYTSVNYRSRMELNNGAQIIVRPMRLKDAEIEQAFVRSLSERSRYLRFFSAIKELSPYMLEKLTTAVFPENYALIATTVINEQEQQVGVARYAATDEAGVAEFAVVVADAWQGLGIASYLLQGVVSAAAAAGLKRIEGMVMKENLAMLNLAQEHGFTLSNSVKDLTLVNAFKVLKTSKD